MATAVRGRVIRSSTKAPLIGITVEAINVSTGVSAGSDETDSQGFFNVNGLTDASYFPRPLVYGQDWDIQSDLNVLVGGSLYLPDETTTPRVQVTNADHGGIVGLGSGHTYDDTDGTGTYHFRLSQVDGKAYFGGGNATLDADGITLTSNATLNITAAHTDNSAYTPVNVSITKTGTGSLAGNDTLITTSGASAQGEIAGTRGRVTTTGSGGVTSINAVSGLLTSSGSAGTLVTANASSFSVTLEDAENITEAYGSQIIVTKTGGTGTITDAVGARILVDTGTNQKGILIAGPSSGANNYAIYSSATAQSVHAGNLRIGSTTAPTAALDVTGNIVVSGNVDGVDVSAHTHTGAGTNGAQLTNSALNITYSAFTFTIVGGGGVGNGTTTARYTQIGKTVIGQMDLVFGTTTALPVGVLQFSMPVTAATSTGGLADVGTFWAYDASVGTFATGVVYAPSTTAFGFIQGGTGVYTNTVPWTWTTSDQIHIEFEYEAA